MIDRQRPRSRVSTVLAVVLAPLAVATVAGLVLLWPPGQQEPAAGVAIDVTYHDARVTSLREASCQGGEVEDRLPDGTIPDEVSCILTEVEILDGEQSGQSVQILAPYDAKRNGMTVGTRVVVEHYPDEDVWAWSDFARGVPLAVLAVVFAALVTAVAGWRGLRSLAGLGVSFAVIGVFILPSLLAGNSPLLVGLVGSSAIVFTLLYLVHGFSARTTIALVGTLCGLLVTATIGAVMSRAAFLDGLTTDDRYQLDNLTGEQSLRAIFVCGVIVAGLGVLNDVTITQASAVWELKATDPALGSGQLFGRGMRIGRDHIASTVYTMAFAYVGAALPVMLLLRVYEFPLSRALTNAEFAEEIARTLVGSIGLVLAIPLTTLIAAWVVTATPRQAWDAAARRGRHAVTGSDGHHH